MTTGLNSLSFSDSIGCAIAVFAHHNKTSRQIAKRCLIKIQITQDKYSQHYNLCRQTGKRLIAGCVTSYVFLSNFRHKEPLGPLCIFTRWELQHTALSFIGFTGGIGKLCQLLIQPRWLLTRIFCGFFTANSIAHHHCPRPTNWLRREITFWSRH